MIRRERKGSRQNPGARIQESGDRRKNLTADEHRHLVFWHGSPLATHGFSRIKDRTTKTRRARRKGKALTESAENSEDDLSVDTRGSLKVPCKQGVPIGTIGTNGECLVPRINKLTLGPQDLSNKPLSDPS